MPSCGVLPWMAKGPAAPSDLVAIDRDRKIAERDVVSSHGEASRFFVTFLDNHDFKERFYHQDPGDRTATTARCRSPSARSSRCRASRVFSTGPNTDHVGPEAAPEAVREALWGASDAFDHGGAFAAVVRDLCSLRARHPALRYGRQYFRPVSGDGVHFGLSHLSPGVLAFSRILSGGEVLVVANGSTEQDWTGHVMVDACWRREPRCRPCCTSIPAV